MTSDDHIRNPDPAFPGRPQHPDFFVLSEAVIENDKYGDRGRTVERVKQFIDMDSLVYMVRGRIRSLRKAGVEMNHSGAWIDGFTAGCEYERRKLERQYGTGKSGGA